MQCRTHYTHTHTRMHTLTMHSQAHEQYTYTSANTNTCMVHSLPSPNSGVDIACVLERGLCPKNNGREKLSAEIVKVDFC